MITDPDGVDRDGNGRRMRPEPQDRSTTPLTREEIIATARALFGHYGWSNPGDIAMRANIEKMRDMALSSASETAPPTDVDELIAELKSALEELRIAGATPKCQRCDYPNCYCKDVPASTTGHKR
jgi:hypothetical protein